jgi:hypothetical protein
MEWLFLIALLLLLLGLIGILQSLRRIERLLQRAPASQELHEISVRHREQLDEISNSLGTIGAEVADHAREHSIVSLLQAIEMLLRQGGRLHN